jgi:hypothetical protein
MDRTDNQLRACIKALEDVIGPALDPADAQAAEQHFLVTDYLRHLRGHLDHLGERTRFDTVHHLRIAKAIVGDAGIVAPAAADALHEAIGDSETVLQLAGAPTGEVKAAAARLAAAIRRTIRDAAEADSGVRTRIERRVLEFSSEKIEFDRAWHLPQGLEPDPASVVPLDRALLDARVIRYR